MRSVLDDPDQGSPWSRLYHGFKRRRQEIANEILSGELDPLLYRFMCGRIREVDQSIAEMEAAIRGDDVRRPPPEPLPEY